MIKVKFCVEASAEEGYEECMEFKEGTSEKEIKDEFQKWKERMIDASWDYTED